MSAIHRFVHSLAVLLLLTACQVGNASQESETVSSSPPPGAAPYSTELRQRLDQALQDLGSDYVPRTHHLTNDGQPRFTNRLILEDSPYLVQHAHNPVDWYPWGPEAFARARAEDKPIFLSIGYSTCHWCHVMERESFENEDIAHWLNTHFVSIKIDRERRPDIDEIYMTAVQLLNQRGGWPLSSFLTSDGNPFYGGTYFPPDRFLALLQRITEVWAAERGQVAESAERLATAVRQATAARGVARSLGDEVFGAAVEHVQSRHDAALGGFGRAPKFPHEPELLYLLDQSLRHGDPRTLEVAVHSLDAMARGGIYDQVGGGFHRYSVDAQWLVPHFEKMLYNQAHLSRAYAAAYQLTGKPSFERVARQTLDYVLEEMTAPGGGFYSATDADSEGEEGIFFVWTPQQLQQALPPEDAALAMDLWGVQDGGNFEGRSILFLDRTLEDYARQHQRPVQELIQQVEGIRRTLRQAREQRPHPLRDDKILTAWNGMMITALCQAAVQLDEPRYADAARRAADFLWRHNLRDDGSLWRVHLHGSSSVNGLQEDYAYLAEALLALYDVHHEAVWLARARQLVDRMLQDFWDTEQGGFFMTQALHDPPLISRPKSPNDGAIPSGNSVAVRAMAQLGQRLEDGDYGDRAQQTAAAFAEQIHKYPHGYAYLLTGLAEQLQGAAGPLAYGARGHLRAQLSATEVRQGRLTIDLDLRLDDGWHINSTEPRQEHLRASRWTVAPEDERWRRVDVTAPTPVDIEVDFEDRPLSVYSGRSRWSMVLESSSPQADDARRIVLDLHVQACDDRRCLKPEILRLELPLGSLGPSSP